MVRNIINVAPIMPGDTVVGSCIFLNGYCTDGAAAVRFLIPVAGPVAATNVTITELVGSIRQNNGYRYGTDWDENTDILACATKCTARVTPFGIAGDLMFPTSAVSGVTNNSVLALTATKLTLDFS